MPAVIALYTIPAGVACIATALVVGGLSLQPLGWIVVAPAILWPTPLAYCLIAGVPSRWPSNRMSSHFVLDGRARFRYHFGIVRNCALRRAGELLSS
jgi:hypothetical protein